LGLVSGDFSLFFDDSVVTGAGTEDFIPVLVTTLSLSPNPIGTTTFDTTNAGAWLRFKSGALTDVLVGGNASGSPSAIAAGTDDFFLYYSGTSAATLSPDSISAVTTGDTGIGSDYSPTGWVKVVPEPSTALLLATGLAGLAAAGRRQRS
jgi:hypothetical protein